MLKFLLTQDRICSFKHIREKRDEFDFEFTKTNKKSYWHYGMMLNQMMWNYDKSITQWKMLLERNNSEGMQITDPKLASSALQLHNFINYSDALD